jgi:hypothetical protein
MDAGIFKEISINENIDLNKYIDFDDAFYYKNNNCIVKSFRNRNLYNWELYVYMKLLKHDIIPSIINVSDNKLEFDTSNIISLKESIDNGNIFSQHKITINSLINNVMLFLNHIKTLGINNDNLNLDTLYVSKEGDLKFYIIDLSNIKLKKVPSK